MRKRGTSRNETSWNRAYFAYNLFVYGKHVSWDEMGRMVPFQFFWRPTKICEADC
jgi:hypothetical protein